MRLRVEIAGSDAVPRLETRRLSDRTVAGTALRQNGTLCLLYEGEEQKVCWRLQVKGDEFRMTDTETGYSGTGKIRPGNPDNL